MRARAEAVEATRFRILEAFGALFMERFVDDITLEEVARRASVTVQTVIRRFGSKERLLVEAADAFVEDVRELRGDAAVGDVRGAVRNLLDDYEQWGDQTMRALAQEERFAALRPVLDAGRELHYAWIERVFAPFLVCRRGAARRRLRAQLIAVCDVYVWKLFRRDLDLSRRETARALEEMITGLLGGEC